MRKLILMFFSLLFLITAYTNQSFSDGVWKTYTSISTIYDFTLQDNYIWCATLGGVVWYDIQNDSYTTFTTVDGLNSLIIRSITIAPNGNIWALDRDQGLFELNGTEWSNLGNNYLTHSLIMATDSTGAIWFGDDRCECRSSYTGIANSFDGTEWIEYKNLQGSPLSGEIYKITVDPEGNIWFATRDGCKIPVGGCNQLHGVL